MYDVEKLGQVFTPESVVQAMLALRRTTGVALEPSCGDGAFFKRIDGCTGVELDERHAPSGAVICDFFAFPENKYQCVIGNPPYVRYQDIGESTKALLNSSMFDGRSNLYLFFIAKAVRHLAPGGELIFITPRDFLKATASVKLNQWLFANGTITDVIELGDARVFQSAVPNCVIWRFEKDNFDRSMRYAQIGSRDQLGAALASPDWQPRFFCESNGQLYFLRDRYTIRLKDIASVKVGAVSGADEIYANEEAGNADFVCSVTQQTGKTRKMIWAASEDQCPDVLFHHKQRLISRGIRQFDESNWWQWGRQHPQTKAPRIYVNAKTRNKRPFFIHPCPNFDGSVMAVFPNSHVADLGAFCDALNEAPWDELGFVCDNRFLFSQRSLENTHLPDSFNQFLATPQS